MWNNVNNLLQLVGVGYANAKLRKIGVCVFIDNEQFSNVKVLMLKSLFCIRKYKLSIYC